MGKFREGANMTEASIRRWLIKLLKPCAIKLQPIESGSTGIGIPDFYFRTAKQGGWIELKVGKLNAKGEIKLRWQPGQLNWIREHAKLLGKTFLFIGLPPNLIMILRLNATCMEYAYIDPLIESAHYICEQNFISRERIIAILNTC